MAQKAAAWLLAAQNGNGGWGGEKGVAPSIEETAVAVDALAEFYPSLPGEEENQRRVKRAIVKGLAFLLEETKEGQSISPSPIGFYFAKLWYFEDLYPWIFTISALNSARKAV
jgi:squalene-hopene/tetraprenyl-beta-curcumene cyclase